MRNQRLSETLWKIFLLSPPSWLEDASTAVPDHLTVSHLNPFCERGSKIRIRETVLDNNAHPRWLTNDYQQGIYTIYRLSRCIFCLIINIGRRDASSPPSLTRPLQFLPRTARNKASPLKARQMHFTRESGSRVTRIKVLFHAVGASERRQESSRARRLGRRRRRRRIQRTADN